MARKPKLPLVGGRAPMKKLPGVAKAGGGPVKPVEPNKPMGMVKPGGAMGFKRRRPRGESLKNTGVGSFDMPVKPPGIGGRY